MTKPTPSAPEEPNGATDAGIGNEVEEVLDTSLQTFDEMLPATRAFYRKSSRA